MKSLLCALGLLVGLSAFGQASIKRNYFTTNQDPEISFTNGTLVSTNIYVSNLFATNLTVNYITNINEFRGRTTITTNLYTTNAVIQFLTNNYFYTTNVTEQFVTNQLSYITNLYGPFITNNNLYSTNIYTTNLFATYVTNNTDYITNLYGPFITNDFIYTTNIFNSTAYVTNLYGPFITNFQLYSTDIFVTNLTANYITNLQDITTNLYVSNAFFTNLTVEFITNDFLFVTNLYNSNAFITNLTANYITNNTSYTTNLISSNIYTTNIFVMEASWFTNRWVGPTNDVNFDATYQNFVASTDMEITGFQNSIATNANTSVLLLDPGGATRTLYFPAPWTNFTSDGNNAYVIPKTNTAIVTLFQYGNLYTNVVVRLFGPGTGTPAPVAQVWTNNTKLIYPLDTAIPVYLYADTNGNMAMGTNALAGADGSGANVSENLAIGHKSLLTLNFADGNSGNNTALGYRAMESWTNGYNNTVMGHLAGLTIRIGDRNTFVGEESGEGSGVPTDGTNYDCVAVGYESLYNVGNAKFLTAVGSESLENVTGSENTGLGYKAGFTVTAGTSNVFLGFMADSTSATATNSIAIGSKASVTGNNQVAIGNTATDFHVIAGNATANGFQNGTLAATNFFSGYVSTSTNQNQVTPDFSVPEQLMSTNAAFTFLAPVGVDATKTTVQWTLVNVTNTTAAAVLITSPANCHTVGTAYVTNLTAVWFQCYAQKFTNAFYIPVF